MHLLKSSAASLAVLVLAASACKKAPPPPDPLPPPPAPVAVSSLELGKSIGADKRITNSESNFGLRDTIYASVGTTGASSGATLTAKWTHESGQTVDSTTQTIAPTGPATTEFHIAKASAWPVGKYRVWILLNGSPTMDKEFEVKR